MSDAPPAPRPALGHAKRHSSTRPVCGVFPQPLSDVSREALGTSAPCLFVSGELRGCQVLVRKTGDIAILANMGFFGINLNEPRTPNRPSDRREKEPLASGDSDEDNEQAPGDESSEPESPTDGSPDPKRARLEDSEEPQVVRKPSEPPKQPPQLLLSSYEAFFLLHSVGMLRIFLPDDSRKEPLSILEFWKLLCSRIRVFPYHYAVYFFYRAKGWVPKHGLRVGAHFTLYPQGPPFFHAAYSVRVQVLRSDTLTCLELLNTDSLSTMKDLMTLHRVTSKVDKKLVLCYVIVPENLSDTSSPAILSSLKVKEVMVERFRP